MIPNCFGELETEQAAHVALSLQDCPAQQVVQAFQHLLKAPLPLCHGFPLGFLEEFIRVQIQATHRAPEQDLRPGMLEGRSGVQSGSRQFEMADRCQSRSNQFETRRCGLNSCLGHQVVIWFELGP